MRDMDDKVENNINPEARQSTISSEKENDQHFEKIQVIIFKLGDEEYAIKIDQIKEVVLTPAVTKMPQTQHYVKGVANIRGNIIAIIDLEEKFEIVEKGENATGQYTLVVESEELKVGILVREVPNTLTVSEDKVDAMPTGRQESLNKGVEASNESNFIKGIIKLEDKLVFLIDVFKVVTENEINVNSALKHQKQKL